jgi:hypothetical protein
MLGNEARRSTAMTTGHAVEPATPTQRLARSRWLQPLRWLIMVALIVGIAAWLDLTPRHASAADFAHDLRTGQVDHYQVGSIFEIRHLTPLSVFEDPDSGDGGTMALWSTGPFHRYAFDLDELPGEEQGRFSPEREARRFALANLGGKEAPSRVPVGSSWSERIAGPVTGFAYLALIVVLGRGPQPRRATKWSLFFIYGIPGGLGAFWALFREAPWSRSAMMLPEPPPGPWPGRWTGGKTLILVALTYSVVLALASTPLTEHPGGSGNYRLGPGGPIVTTR